MITGQPQKPLGDQYSKLELLREFQALHKRINEVFRVGPIDLGGTLTLKGITGAQTINKLAGSVNFAAGATTLVVTNSFVDEESLVFAAVRSNDATALIKNIIPAAGSFTIRLNAAATAETSVGFFVLN